MSNEDKIDRVLPLMFRQVKVPLQAKAKLKARLFETFEVSDDELDFVAAAGDPAERERKNKTEPEE